MITSIQTSNFSDYKALFDEAADILSGYKKVRTYDKTVSQYYAKNTKAETANEVYTRVEGITDLGSFASKLKDNKGALYIKHGNAVEGFDPKYGITSLEEYFSWLKTLSYPDELNKENLSEEERAELISRRKYVILPLDEDHFVINGNTRAINIPASFKKNGIAVQGDHLAEIVYFEVDRYFDYMDLNNTEIFIQWEAPKNAQGEVVKGISKAYVRDIESKPGKLIFGWAISDVITNVSGNLKFSVRFFEWVNADDAEAGTNKDLGYSFSTLTASVPVQPSINLSLTDFDLKNVDDAGRTLIERIENGAVVGGYEAKAPEFAVGRNLSTNEYDLDPVTKTLTLHVHAFADDTGAISYVWKYQGLNDNNDTTGEEIVSSVVENEMINVLDVVDANGNKILTRLQDMTEANYPWNLYIKNGDIYSRYTGSIPPSAEDIADEDFALYERHSKFVADKAGVYWAVAENRLTNSLARTESIKARFPMPKDIKINKQPVNGILNDNEYELKVEVEDQEDKASNPQKKSYQWYWSSKKTLNSAGDEDYDLIDGATSATYNATVEGHYKVEITNTRNEESKTLMSNVVRVTNPAEVPVFETIAEGANTFLVSKLSTNKPKITLSDSVFSDAYTVEWYHVDGSKADMLVETQNLEAGVRESTLDILAHEAAIKEYSSTKDIDGRYYALVINHVNGTEAKTSMPSDDNNNNNNNVFIVTD